MQRRLLLPALARSGSSPSLGFDAAGSDGSGPIVHSLSSRTVPLGDHSTMRFRAQACDYHTEAINLLHEARRGPVPTIWIHETPPDEGCQESSHEEDDHDDECEVHVEAQGESLPPVPQQTYDSASNKEQSEKSFSIMRNGASSSVNSGSTVYEEAHKSRSRSLSHKVLSTRSQPRYTPTPTLHSPNSPGFHSDGSERSPTVAFPMDMTSGNEGQSASDILQGQSQVDDVPATGPRSALHLLQLASDRPDYQEENASIEKSECGTLYSFDERSTSSETEFGELVS
jgi:hypothetical protein